MEGPTQTQETGQLVDLIALIVLHIVWYVKVWLFFQALEEEFARQLSEQERFYSGAYQADVKAGYSFPSDSLSRSSKDNRLSTAM